MNKLEDLKFILESMEDLVVDPEMDFGPAYGLAEERRKLSMIKLRRLIQEEKWFGKSDIPL
jgi:hypothetical protein